LNAIGLRPPMGSAGTVAGAGAGRVRQSCHREAQNAP
jgi:hypothetical protein